MKYYFLLFFLSSMVFNPSNAGNTNLVSLGTSYGGWTIPRNLLTKESIIYCAGAGLDISFDVGLVTMFDCDVYIFDPTPRAIDHFKTFKEKLLKGEKFYTIPGNFCYKLDPRKLHKLHYYPVGLWSEDKILKFFVPRDSTHVSHSVLNLQKTNSYFEASCKSLRTLMNELGHNHLDLLKLDIEGSEYEVLESILRDNIDVKCICIEFDEMAGVNKWCNTDIKGTIERIKNYIRKLERYGYELIYDNGYCDMTFLKK